MLIFEVNTDASFVLFVLLPLFWIADAPRSPLHDSKTLQTSLLPV